MATITATPVVTAATFTAFGAIDAIIDGVALIVPDDPANSHRRLIATWVAAGNQIAAYIAPPAPEPERAVSIYAVARMTIVDGDINGMDMTAGLAGAFRFDVGQYWVFFTDEQSDTDYFALVYDNGDVRGFVREVDKFSDYFVVSTVDFAGVAADAENLCVEIKRVN